MIYARTVSVEKTVIVTYILICTLKIQVVIRQLTTGGLPIVTIH